MDQVELRDVDIGLELAVTVRGAYKRYAPNSVILRGLNMNVKEGTIYALLGPSGCGKTTLLRCMMGRTSLDAGEIVVKAKRLRNVGYMPQELALHNEMSIAENFNFYGRLCGMSWDEIHSRGVELLKFLALPKESCLIGTLSGGQQRRVSLAVALLHDPQLFILDEPTVGVDPVLSYSIWQRLLEMAELHKKTIIITTHYIEEARQAHSIGLMRNGCLLAEEAPLDLMFNNNCSSLEEAFLKLSRKQEDVQIFKEESLAYPTPSTKPLVPLESGSIWSTKRFLAQLIKNLVFNMRNIPMLCFIIFLPALQAYLCNSILGQEPKNLMVGFVSDELPNGLSDCNVYSNLTCSQDGLPLSCKYLEQLRRKTIALNEFDDINYGIEQIRKGKLWAVLHFAKNYTSSVYERINFGQNTPDDVIDWSNVNVFIDMSNLWIGTMLKRDLVLSLVGFYKELFVDCGASPELGDLPFKIADPIYGEKDPVYIHFATPGIIITFCFYLPVMFTTGAIMSEKAMGLLERSLSAGMSVLEIVAAHTVIQFIFSGLQNMIILLIFYVIFFNPLYGSLAILLTLLHAVEFAGMCYAFLLAVFFDSEKLATYSGVGTIVVMFVLCGVVWPYQGMHWALQSIVWMIPIQPAVEAYRAVSERAWGIQDDIVYLGFLSTLIWIIIFSGSAYLIAKKKKIGL